MIRDFLQEIQSTVHSYKPPILPESDLILELYPIDDSKFHCGYYLAHHPTQSIYWLEQTDLTLQSDTLCEINGQVSGYQTSESPVSSCDRGPLTSNILETCLEYEYWYANLLSVLFNHLTPQHRSYWDSFPDVQMLTPKIYDYIVGIIASAMMGEPSQSLELQADPQSTIDVVLLSSSTITYTYEKLENMMKIIQVAKGVQVGK